MSITDKAAKQLQSLLKTKNDPSVMGIKIGVKRQGCSGLSYTMNYAKESGKLDEVVEQQGTTVIVDSRAVMFLVGTEMDYVTNELQSEFIFTNPNAKGTCGCGQSFTV